MAASSPITPITERDVEDAMQQLQQLQQLDDTNKWNTFEHLLLAHCFGMGPQSPPAAKDVWDRETAEHLEKVLSRSKNAIRKQWRILRKNKATHNLFNLDIADAIVIEQVLIDDVVSDML